MIRQDWQKSGLSAYDKVKGLEHKVILQELLPHLREEPLLKMLSLGPRPHPLA